MRIGIDVQTLLGPHRSGLYFLTLNLLEALLQLASGHRYVGFFSGTPDHPDVGRLRQQFPTLAVKRFAHPGWPYNVRMRLNAANRVSVFQYINSVTIPVHPKRINAFFLPDLTTVLFPQWHVEQTRNHWEGIFAVARAHGDLILTSSEHTKKDIINHLGIPDDKIVAIPLAAAQSFRPVEPDTDVTACLARWGLNWKGYLLSVGTIEPRKNHMLLLNAFRKLKDCGLADNQLLVLAGAQGWLCQPVLDAIDRLRLTEHVRLLGHVDPLHVLYAGASMMVYPSFYEGFGLPPLEAMACGTPVITSNASSLPEVVGEAAIVVDPNDVDGLAAGIARVLSDRELQLRMRRDGLARAAGFSWRRTAARTEAAYQSAWDRRRHG